MKYLNRFCKLYLKGWVFYPKNGQSIVRYTQQIIILLFAIVSAVNCLAKDWKAAVIDELNGGSTFVLDPSGNIVISHNIDKLMVPASILKIATADAVMTHLGENYSIPTEFYLTPDNYLGIKGFGDPTLVSESLSAIAVQLKKQQAMQTSGKLKGFWLDSSFFKSHIKIHGQSSSDNPYDSSNGALVANFNTIYVHKARNGKISSAEPQTPLTATAIRLAKKLSAGKHRINLGSQYNLTLLYFSELLQAFLKREGIDIPVRIINKPIPENSKKIFVHQSAPVSEIIEQLFSFSNNFIANQLLIILGGEQKGAPADLEKGKQVVKEFLMNIVGINHFILEEGSGLSRKNQFTAADMMSLLIHFQPHQDLLRIDQDRFQAKTGTLKGISTYAGYMISPSGDNYPFVIMLDKSKWGSDRNKIANQLYRGVF